MADPWDAFGEEDDEDDTDSADEKTSSQLNASNTDQHDAAVAVSTALIQRWINQGDIVSLRHRRILLVIESAVHDHLPDSVAAKTELRATVNCWKDIFSTKSIQDVISETTTEVENDKDSNRLYDAIIWLLPSQIQSMLSRTLFLGRNEALLIPGGYLILRSDLLQSTRSAFSDSMWDFESSDSIEVWTFLPKWSCIIDGTSCKWLSKKHSIENERRMLSSATVSLSVHERENGFLNPTLLNKAVIAIRQHGYCIVSGLLHKEIRICLDYGAAAMADIQTASEILKHEGVDLFDPSQSLQEPGIYRELSMREDCRMDIRHGPALDAIRGPRGGASMTFKAMDQGDENMFLRGNKNILSIVRRAMNPSTPKHRSIGNYGRYNFEGSGPDGSDRDLVCGPVGAIVNLPGSGDQAIHADTPHLFEHVIDHSPLPPHYMNVFTLGCAAMENVGQTAFIHGSHSLEFVASHVSGSSDTNDSPDPFLPSLWKHLVRPRMALGDVAIFDCRILHFGLSNGHKTIARPMLYSNMTLHWFNDPKNWNEETSIFNTANKQEVRNL